MTRQSEHRAISLIVLFLLVLVLLAISPLHAQHPDWALSGRAAAQLADDWQRETGDSIACLYGRRVDATLWIDSASAPTTSCAGAFGAVAFYRGRVIPGSEPVYVATLLDLLAHTPEWQFVAVVCGVAPAILPGGQHVQVPQFFYAYRHPADAPQPSVKGDT